MQYESLTPQRRREIVADNLARLEEAHYTQVLTRIANTRNDPAARQVDEGLAVIEASVDRLREELARVDELIASTAPTAAPVVTHATPRPGNLAGGPVVEPQAPAAPAEPPAPATTVSAVHGDVSASEPQTDAPTS